MAAGDVSVCWARVVNGVPRRGWPDVVTEPESPGCPSPLTHSGPPPTPTPRRFMPAAFCSSFLYTQYLRHLLAGLEENNTRIVAQWESRS